MRSDQLKEELKTIQDRTISIRLSDADCVRLAEKAGSVNLSVGDLLKFFICDLVNGTHSLGSDERYYAEQWFDRAGFAELADRTFLSWLLRYDDVYEFIGHYELLEECREDLRAENPVNSHQSNLDEMEYQENWLKERYHEYATGWGAKRSVEAYEEAIDRIFLWHRETRQLQGDKSQTYYDAELERKRHLIAKLFDNPAENIPLESAPEEDPEPEI